jgi:spore maturation protein CgeB
MKLMIVGSDKIFAIENFYVRYLRQAGIEVYTFSAQSIFYDYYKESLLNKLIFKTGFSGILKKINLLFREAVEQFNPEVIWVFKGMEISPDSLLWTKNKGIKLLNYNPDNPFIFSGRGSGNQYVIDALPLYDLHFTYNLEIQQQLKDKYQARTAYLPFGFDISEELFNKCASQKEIGNVCFLGNPDRKRAGFLKALSDKNITIDIFGNSWNKFISGDGITIYPPVYGDELWKVLRRYRVQLNMMRIHNENSHNMRTFEVPGVGGIMIAPETKEHEMFFKNGKEIFLYKDATTCAAIIKQVLSLSYEEANQIRYNARDASLERGYQYKDRAIKVLEVIKSL